jgi:hypothetical protein
VRIQRNIETHSLAKCNSAVSNQCAKNVDRALAYFYLCSFWSTEDVNILRGSIHAINNKKTMYYAYNIILRGVYVSNVAVEKQYYILVSACSLVYVRVPGRVDVGMRVRACSLAYPHATYMRHIVTSLVTPLDPPHFSTFCHGGHDFRKNIIRHKVCVFGFLFKHFSF